MQLVGLVPAIAVMAGKADQIVKAAGLHDEITDKVIHLESGSAQFRTYTLGDMSLDIENLHNNFKVRKIKNVLYSSYIHYQYNNNRYCCHHLVR